MSRVRIALVVWLLLDLWRLWTPSLITIYGQAASTPPEQIGVFALAVMGAPILVVALVQRFGATARLPAAVLVALAVVARLVAPFDGGQWQLWVASVGVAAAASALALATQRGGTDLWPGVFFGLAFATATHAALGTWAAVWRQGPVEVALDLLMVLVLIWPGPVERPPSAIPARTSWLVLPVLLLAGICLANPARADAALPMVGSFVAVVAAVLASHFSDRVHADRRLRLAAGLVVVLAVASLMLPEASHDGVVGHLPVLSLLGLAAGLPALAVALSGERAGRSDRSALSAAAGGLLFTAVLFAFYAGYDLGYRADWVVVLTAVVVVVGGALGVPDGRGWEISVRGVVWAPLVAGVAVALSVVTVPGPAAPVAGEDGTLDVVAWNLRMGYGMDGTFEIDEVADQIGPGTDVVLLSEVDRGWFLNGGQDQLAILARLLDMEYVWAPAADQVWGDAILTRLPVVDQWSEALPEYDSLTGAQVLTTVLDVEGEEVAFVATHLQPDSGVEDGSYRQAVDLARIVREAADRTPYVVAGGDLNLTPDDPSWQVLLDTGLTDALASARPLPTSPADAPSSEIDHLLLSPSMGVPVEASAPASELSDHLMVRVRLAWPVSG